MPEQKRKVTSGRDIKQRRTQLLTVGEDMIWRVNATIDMPSLLLVGAMPTPLLAAIDRLNVVRERSQREGLEKTMGGLNPDERAGFLAVIRRLACITVLQPRLTESKLAASQDPDLLWVGGYSDIPSEIAAPGQVDTRKDENGDVGLQPLMVVYRYVMKEGGLAIMPDDEADEFRAGQSEPAIESRTDGAAVQSAPVVVDLPVEPEQSFQPEAPIAPIEIPAGERIGLDELRALGDIKTERRHYDNVEREGWSE